MQKTGSVFLEISKLSRHLSLIADQKGFANFCLSMSDRHARQHEPCPTYIAGGRLKAFPLWDYFFHKTTIETSKNTLLRECHKLTCAHLHPGWAGLFGETDFSGVYKEFHYKSSFPALSRPDSQPIPLSLELLDSLHQFVEANPADIYLFDRVLNSLSDPLGTLELLVSRLSPNKLISLTCLISEDSSVGFNDQLLFGVISAVKLRDFCLVHKPETILMSSITETTTWPNHVVAGISFRT